MHPRLVHRVLLAVLPAVALGATAVTTVWGENGLLRRQELSAELRQANHDLSKLQADNQRMLRALHLLEADPVAMERAVAEELGWAKPGTTLYRFEPVSQVAKIALPGSRE